MPIAFEITNRDLGGAMVKAELVLIEHERVNLGDLASLYGSGCTEFRVVFDAIRELMTPPVKSKRRIGFVE